LNGLTGIVGISAGSNITITPSGNTLTISASGGGGGGSTGPTGPTGPIGPTGPAGADGGGATNAFVIAMATAL
jgi:hypothetical protein